MIYLITNQATLYPIFDNIKLLTLKDGLKAINTLGNIIGADLETEGFDPYTKKILSIQLGDYIDQYIFDSTIDYKILKPFFESPTRKFIFHNAKFDLKFLYHQGIIPDKVLDTFLHERLITLGENQFIGQLSLDGCLAKYLGVTLDKSIRKTIKSSTFSEKILQYAANDVKYLVPLAQAQMQVLEHNNLLYAASVENQFVKALAYTEYGGIKLDTDKWKAKMLADITKYNEAESALNDWLLATKNPKYIDSYVQSNLFTGTPDKVCNINWGSPQQVSALFTELGFNLDVIDKKTKKTKKSVERPVLLKQLHISDVAQLYINYQDARKVVTTYGESFLNALNPVTHRIHTQFNQLMDTGRLSSGGKDRDKGISLINLQNIPSDATTRNAFVPEKGNCFIDADYSGQEKVIQVNFSMDKDLLAFYDNDLGDMHSYIASKIYPELKDVPLQDIKSKYPEERKKAKSGGFAIDYGGDGNTIANNLGISVEMGNQIYENYFKAFPGLNDYFNKVEEQAWETGFIEINPITKHRRLIPNFDKLQEIKSQMDYEFWQNYKREKAKNSKEFTLNYRPKIKEFFQGKSRIRKLALNTPIQGTGAVMTKIAATMLFNYIIAHNLIGKVFIVNQVHDELLVECPKDLAPNLSNIIKYCMEQAGNIFCQRVKLQVVPSIGQHWEH